MLLLKRLLRDFKGRFNNKVYKDWIEPLLVILLKEISTHASYSRNDFPFIGKPKNIEIKNYFSRRLRRRSSLHLEFMFFVTAFRFKYNLTCVCTKYFLVLLFFNIQSFELSCITFYAHFNPEMKLVS